MKLWTTAFLAISAIAGAGLAVSIWPFGRGSVMLDEALKLPGLQSLVSIAAAETSAAPPAPRSVRIVRPEPAPGSSTLTLSGRTAPAEQALISSRATGVVAERRVDIGDHVKAGDVLLTIDAPEVEQELLRAKASVDQIKARLELASVNLQRAENLVGDGHISVQTVDERRANKMIADADLAAAVAEVRRLEDVSSFQTVRAPFDGTVVARQVERGDRVSSDSSQQGTYLLRIAGLKELRIEIDVPQSSSLLVRPGAEAKVTFAELPGETLSARVVRTAGLIEQASNTMRAELLMPNPDARVPAGLNGQVVIVIPQTAGAVTVPTNTLLIRDGKQMVALADTQSRVVLRPVSVARDLGDRVVIIAGLTPEDRVILSPNALLRPGDEVQITMPTAQNNSAKK